MIINENGFVEEIEGKDIKDGKLVFPDGVKKIPNLCNGDYVLDDNKTVHVKFKSYHNNSYYPGYFNEDRYAFLGKIKEIHLPDSVVEVSGFSYLSNLEKIELSENLVKIPERCFEKCIQLKNIEIKDGLKQIEDEAFAGCNKLERLVIPDSVEEMGKNVFIGNEKLEFLHLPNKISEISKTNLLFSNNLNEIVLPDSLKKLTRDDLSRTHKK